MFSKKAIVFIAVAAAAFSAVQAHAAPSIYGDLVGLNPGEPDFLMIREDSVTDQHALYDAPIRLPYGLAFTPLSFTSFSSNGIADTTAGTLSMRIRADIGTYLTTITVSEAGTYSLFPTGVGSSATAATLNGLITATVVDPGIGSFYADMLQVSPNTPYTLPSHSFGQFTAAATIDLTGLGIREIVLTVNNNLQTSSETGTSSFIQKNSIIVSVPEPTAAAMLALGALLAFRRRR